MSMSEADILLDAINTTLDKYGCITETDRVNLDKAIERLYELAEGIK